MAFCEHCLKEVPEGEVLCTECAAVQAAAAPPAAEEAAVSRSASGAPQFRVQFTPPPAPPVATEPRFEMPLTASQLPRELKPLGAWAFFGYGLLFMIPLVGLVVAIVFACGGTSRVCLKNYARSVLLAWLFALIAAAGAAALLFGLGFLPFLAGGAIPW